MAMEAEEKNVVTSDAAAVAVVVASDDTGYSENEP